jgi:hypothetical protein
VNGHHLGSWINTLIDLSTTGDAPGGGDAADRKIAWVDSPVSGGVAGATKNMAVMVSCAKPTFEGRSAAQDVRQTFYRREAWAGADRGSPICWLPQRGRVVRR